MGEMILPEMLDAAESSEEFGEILGDFLGFLQGLRDADE
jgi:hypothetical protein